MISNKIKFSCLRHYKYVLKAAVFQSNKLERSISTCKKFSNYISSFKKNDVFPKNIVFFGNDHFSLATLKKLYQKKNEGKIENLHVVTHLMKPYTPVALFCREMNIYHSKWPIEVSICGYDIGVVVSFGHLIPEDIIQAFPLGILNVHGSILPRWRGPNPVVHAILNGDKETGVTVINIHPFRFDTGNIVYQKSIKIEKNMKSQELTSTLAEVGAECLIYCLNNINLLKHSKDQSDVGVTKAPKIKNAFCEVIWDKMTPKTISLMFHAFDYYNCLWSTWHGRNIQLQELVPEGFEEVCTDNKGNLTMYEYIKDLKKTCVKKESESIEKEIEFNKGSHVTPGQIVYIKPKRVLRVKCLNGFVEFKSVKLMGKKKMSALDFYNGFITKVDYTKHYFY